MSKVFLSLSLFLALLFFGSCEQAVEGCLDSFSTNYDLFADNSCDSCCVYPTLRIGSTFQINEESIDTIYYKNNLGHYYRLSSIYLILSDFGLSSLSQSYDVRDQIDDLKDDLIKIEYKEGTQTVGTIAFEDELNLISFNVGIPSILDQVDQANRDFELIDFLIDSLYLDANTNKFHQLRFEIEVDSMANDTIGMGFTELNVPIQRVISADILRGNGLSIQLNIDLNRLFKDLPFQDADLFEKAKLIIPENIEPSIKIQ